MEPAHRIGAGLPAGADHLVGRDLELHEEGVVAFDLKEPVRPGRGRCGRYVLVFKCLIVGVGVVPQAKKPRLDDPPTDPCVGARALGSDGGKGREVARPGRGSVDAERRAGI